MANVPFPKPAYFQKQRRWKQSAIINYERGLQGLAPIECDPANERWLTSADLRDRFQCSDMWLWRRTTGADRATAEATHRNKTPP